MLLLVKTMAGEIKIRPVTIAIPLRLLKLRPIKISTSQTAIFGKFLRKNAILG